MSSENAEIETIQIENQLDIKSYIKLRFILFYTRWQTIVLTSLITLYILFVLGRIYLGEDIETTLPIPVMLTVSLLWLFLTPVSIYLGAKKHFNSHLMMQERVFYTFTEELIKVEGESWDSRMTWDKIHNLKQIKNWVLIFENNYLGHIIPKKSFTPDQLEQFISLVKSKPNLKHNFK